MTGRQKAHLAALLSDLVVGIMAFCVEEETGVLRAQRIREIRGTVGGILQTLSVVEAAESAPSVPAAAITREDY